MSSVARSPMATSFPFAEDEGRAAKRQHRQSNVGTDRQPSRTTNTTLPPKPLSDLEARQTMANKRRSTLREQKAPMGPRPPEFASSRRITSESTGLQQPPTSRSFLPNATSEPFLGLSARRTTANFEFGSGRAPMTDVRASGNAVFTLRSGRPGGNDRIESTRLAPPLSRSGTQKQEAKNPPTNTAPIRSQPTSARQVAKPENAALKAAQMSAAAQKSAATSPVASAAPLSLRTRRQSQFTPSSAPQQSAPRSPRKSMGPGMFPTDTANIFRNVGENTLESFESRKTSRNEPPLARKISNPRARPRMSIAPISTSIAPPNKSNEIVNSAPATQRVQMMTSPLLPDPNTFPHKISTTRPRTQDGEGQATEEFSPSGTFRKVHHGLSRTVSPTDAWRTKRVSAAIQAPPVPSRSPTPELTFGVRPIQEPPPAYSKEGSPPSSRTTPEQNIRFSGGPSLSPRSSFSSQRPSSSSWQNAIGQGSKANDGKLKASTPNDSIDAEKVPPVPAIPKAYESPNHTIEEPFFESFEVQPKTQALSQDSTTSTNEFAIAEDRFNPSRDSKFMRRFTLGSGGDQSKVTTSSAAARQSSQAARLPPLVLGPLSIDTTDRIAAIPRKPINGTMRKSTPPPRYSRSRPPSTPMTASKATFPTFDQMPASGQLPLLNWQRSTSSQQKVEDTVPTAKAASKSGPLTRLLTPSPSDLPTLPTTSCVLSDIQSSASDTSTAKKTTGVQSGSEQGAFSTPKPSAQTTRRVETAYRTEKLGDLGSSNTVGSTTPAAQTPTKRRIGLGFRRSSSKASQESSHDRNGAIDQDAIAMPPPKLPASKLWTESLSLSASMSMHKIAERKVGGKSTPGSVSSSDLTKTVPLDGQSKGSGTVRDDTTTVGRLGQRPLSTHRLLFSRTPTSDKQRYVPGQLDADDSAAEDEMKRLSSKRKEFEQAAKEVDDLQKRAKPRDRVSPGQATRAAQLNIFERGEVIDYSDVFFCGTKGAKKLVGDLAAYSANFGYDDERGDYNIVEGDHLAYRYEVVDILGKGSFGQVVRCIDHRHGKLVAVKIIRNKKRFHQQALVEVNILQRLREWDPESQHCMINFTESFYFRGHLCIASELLGINLYEFIKAHDFRGFSLKLVRRFAKQMLACLSVLQSRKVIHCDLKPENILLVHPLRSEIKTIDFGSSCFEHEKVYTYIQSRFYRSPEVILGMDYGMPIDMWSMGCILAELYTGYPIFPGENEQEQLACIMEIFGPPEKHLIERSTRKKVFFDSLGKPRMSVSTKGKRRRPSSKTLQQAIKCDDDAFIDFLTRCLRWDPDRRLKPEEAVAHDFVSGPKTKARLSMAASPAKKPMSLSRTPSRSRPLPDVPLAARKTVAAASSSSPVKSSMPYRRQSTMNMINSGVKRNSNGIVVGSALPRGMSGKPDLASSAAAVASLRQK